MPNWKEAEAHIESLPSVGFGLVFDHQLIETPETVDRYGFRRLPTVLIDGVDPFADRDTPVGLSAGCIGPETDTPVRRVGRTQNSSPRGDLTWSPASTGPGCSN